MKTLDQKIRELSPTRRKKINARAAQLIAEEMSLRELRQAHKLTQERVAEALGIGQDGVSRLEQRSDFLISTLRSYIEAMGGRLSLVAEFPDRKSVILSGIATLDTEPRRPLRRRTARPDLRSGDLRGLVHIGADTAGRGHSADSPRSGRR